MISAIAISPDNSGLMAAGSFTKSLYLYDASGGEPRLIRSLKSKDPSHRGAGVTQVKFHPTMPNYVYSTSRRMNHILMWDIRNSGDIMLALPRPGNTHQRIQFDIDPWGKWLTTGDTVSVAKSHRACSFSRLTQSHLRTAMYACTIRKIQTETYPSQRGI